jgi:hypothetical protein
MLTLAFDRVRKRLKPELQTASATTPRGFEFRLSVVRGQNETPQKEVLAPGILEP